MFFLQFLPVPDSHQRNGGHTFCCVPNTLQPIRTQRLRVMELTPEIVWLSGPLSHQAGTSTGPAVVLEKIWVEPLRSCKTHFYPLMKKWEELWVQSSLGCLFTEVLRASVGLQKLNVLRRTEGWSSDTESWFIFITEHFLQRSTLYVIVLYIKIIHLLLNSNDFFFKSTNYALV